MTISAADPAPRASPAAAPTSASRSQNIVYVFMLGLSIVLGVFVWFGPLVPAPGLSLEKLFVVASLTTAAGLVAAVKHRRLQLWLASGVITAIGLATLALMLVWPRPEIDPFLYDSAAWMGGPVPIEVGWSRLAMSAILVTSGALMPLALSRRLPVAVATLTYVRLALWIGAFWQVADVALQGRFDRLFDPGGGLLAQVCIAAILLVGCLLLLRGDRGWLATLTGADESVSLARYILPVAAAPVFGAYITELGTRYGAYPPSIGPLLNVEISAAAVLLLCSSALRTVWRERRGRESLARALERSPVIIHTEQGVVEYWPRGCETLYEYTAAEAIGRSATELLQTQYPCAFEALEASLRRDGEWVGEVRQTTRSGRTVWVASRIVVDRSADDRVVKLVETLTDITDLRLTHAALRETAESLSQALVAFDLGVIEFDAQNNRVTYSPEFERLVGVGPGELSPDTQAWRRLLTPADAERLANWFAIDARNHAARRTVAHKIIRGDGTMRDLHGMVRYRYAPDGALLHIVGIYMDITDQLRDRADAADRGERLLAMQPELAHTSRLSAMGEMAAALAHELNQPLTAVGNSVGAIELILKDDGGPITEKVRQQVLRASRHAERQAVRAGEIVRRLREFIVRGEADTQAENLEHLVSDAAALALPNPAAAEVEVVTDISPDARWVLANRIQIQQVMVNLIRNAVEAMRDQTGARVLNISAQAADGMATVRVTDTGCGVAAEMVERLFSPFMSSKADGMGVGLSICRRIVEAHGGKMWFEHVDGAGGDFRFTLPLHLPEARNG